METASNTQQDIQPLINETNPEPSDNKSNISDKLGILAYQIHVGPENTKPQNCTIITKLINTNRLIKISAHKDNIDALIDRFLSDLMNVRCSKELSQNAKTIISSLIMKLLSKNFPSIRMNHLINIDHDDEIIREDNPQDRENANIMADTLTVMIMVDDNEDVNINSAIEQFLLTLFIINDIGRIDNTLNDDIGVLMKDVWEKRLTLEALFVFTECPTLQPSKQYISKILKNLSIRDLFPLINMLRPYTFQAPAERDVEDEEIIILPVKPMWIMDMGAESEVNKIYGSIDMNYTKFTDIYQDSSKKSEEKKNEMQEQSSRPFPLTISTSHFGENNNGIGVKDINDKLNTMNEKLNTLNDTMNEKLNTLNDTMNDKLNTLNDTMNNTMNEMNSSIKELMGLIRTMVLKEEKPIPNVKKQVIESKTKSKVEHKKIIKDKVDDKVQKKQEVHKKNFESKDTPRKLG